MLPAPRLGRPVNGLVCLVCRHRRLHASSRRAESEAAKARRERNEPKPLTRAIGWHEPPRAGVNTGADNRSWRERKNDFLDHEKNRMTRDQIIRKLATPYFRDWSNLQYSKGKTFIAPPKLFRAERALYFPNFHGRTLASRKASDTTSLLERQISLVSIFSGTWAERQAASYVGAKQHPELHELLRAHEAALGRIDINVEEGWLKSLLLRLFLPFLRRNVPRTQHHRYFLIRKGVSDDAMDTMGFINRRVGYVYLVDGDCKIRWAASGVATPHEKESLIGAVKKLLEDRSTQKDAARFVAPSPTR